MIIISQNRVTGIVQQVPDRRARTGIQLNNRNPRHSNIRSRREQVTFQDTLRIVPTNTQVYNQSVVTENERNLQRECPIVFFNRETDITPDFFNRIKATYGEHVCLQGPSGQIVTNQDFTELRQRFGHLFTLNLC